MKEKKTQFAVQEFVKSSACGWAGSCVGVAMKNGVIAVTNTTDPKRKTVFFTSEEWAAFIAGAKNGEFDVK